MGEIPLCPTGIAWRAVAEASDGRLATDRVAVAAIRRVWRDAKSTATWSDTIAAINQKIEAQKGRQSDASCASVTSKLLQVCIRPEHPPCRAMPPVPALRSFVFSQSSANHLDARKGAHHQAAHCHCDGDYWTL